MSSSKSHGFFANEKTSRKVFSMPVYRTEHTVFEKRTGLQGPKRKFLKQFFKTFEEFDMPEFCSPYRNFI